MSTATFPPSTSELGLFCADGPPGHALIPALSLSAYQQRKEELKKVLVELARLAGPAIFRRPEDD